MNQHQLEEFGTGQVATIEASSSAADVWIKHHSVRFRAVWEDAMRLEKHSLASVLALHPEPLVRAGIAACLRQHGGFEVFEESRDRMTSHATRFDVVIADYLQAMRLAAASREADGSLAKAKILVLASDARGADIQRALEAGVHGYLFLGGPLGEFIEAATTLARGRRYLGRAVAQRMAEISTRTPLTSRETDVLHLVVSGESNQAIARRLCIEVGTVKTHMTSILGKLNATSRTQAAAIAVAQGLVSERSPQVEPVTRSSQLT